MTDDERLYQEVLLMLEKWESVNPAIPVKISAGFLVMLLQFSRDTLVHMVEYEQELERQG